MTIHIHNTLTHKKEPLPFAPDRQVRLYVCGITAYDYCHIGHARSALVFDMIFRYLLHEGYKVTYIRNFTDIDDKIIKRAQEQNTTCEELSERFIAAFYEDMDRLGVARPFLEPRATRHVAEIVAMIRELMDKGLAYQAGNDVYYAVDRFKSYGKLSGRNLEELKAGARIAVNENKTNPLDFVLWKGSKPGEPFWESPWGPGRPGWHIECSAMSRKYLGDSFDIHGGGQDLIFPHHENEIAQSEGLTGKTFVKLWVHHGFVTIKDEKMSKSQGNFLTIRDVLSRYHPEALRLFVFSTHYRNPLDYSEEAMAHAVAGLDRLYDCLAQLKKVSATPLSNRKVVSTPAEREKIETLPLQFRAAMDDDFNTARALGHIFDAVKVLNRVRQALSSPPAREDLELLNKGATLVLEVSGIMGLLCEDPAQFFKAQKEDALLNITLTKEEIEGLIRERNAARDQKDWTSADAIRKELQSKNIELKDGPDGTFWKVKTM